MTMDPYEVLGVATDASADEIHVAYRDLARRLHPDAGGTDASQMARANDAWRILCDPARRVTYDAAVAPKADRLGPADAWARTREGSVRDISVALQPLLRLIVVTALVLMFLVFVAIVLIGFGRVGVTPQP